MDEYTLELSRGDMLTIDYFIRRDQKTPEGASGKKVLLKVFHARKGLATNLPEHNGDDRTYRENKGTCLSKRHRPESKRRLSRRPSSPRPGCGLLRSAHSKSVRWRHRTSAHKRDARPRAFDRRLDVAAERADAP